MDLLVTDLSAAYSHVFVVVVPSFLCLVYFPSGMLTPSFELSQTEEEVYLLVRAPLANITNTELIVEEDLIVFYSSPYYLRIHLPGRVIEKEGDHGKYYCEKKEFSFQFKKVNSGEHFKDLDMIGKLLIPAKKYQLKPEINVCEPGEEVVPSSDPESDDELLGFIKQEVTTDYGSDLHGYGFANKGRGMGKKLRYEFREILDLVDFENTAVHDRSLLREADEHARFSEDHYLADFMEPEEIEGILEWDTGFKEEIENNTKVKFTGEEKEMLKNIGNRDYLLDGEEKKAALLSLVDILFAFAYDLRTTREEECVESAWTINKLSSTLSWLQSFQTMKEVKTSCARRSLIFPLYRHWSLTEAVFEDTANILKLGRRKILKCLLKIYKMFNNSEPRYLLNELYIIDYCIWIQKISEKKIKTLLELYNECDIKKSDVGLELDELEEAALIVKEEEELDIVNRLMGVTLSDDESDDNEEEIGSTSSSESEPDPSSSETSTDSSIDSDDISSEEE